MRGTYYINITLRFLNLYLTRTYTGIIFQHNYKYMHKPALCTTYYICCSGENEFNSIK